MRSGTADGRLSDILASLRLTGGVVIDGSTARRLLPAFTVHADDCAPFFPMRETLIGYHYVRSGRMLVEVEGVTADRRSRRGEIAVIPRNDPHLLVQPRRPPPLDASEIVESPTGCQRIVLRQRAGDHRAMVRLPWAPPSERPPAARRRSRRCSSRHQERAGRMGRGVAALRRRAGAVARRRQPACQIRSLSQRSADISSAATGRKRMARAACAIRPSRGRCRSSTPAMPRTSTSKRLRARRGFRDRCWASASSS